MKTNLKGNFIVLFTGRIISFTCIFLILQLTSCKIQQKGTINMKQDFVGLIGYGSLMSLKSMESSLGRQYDDSVYTVHLNGYVRAWTSYRLFNDPEESDSSRPKFYGFILQNNDSIPFDGIVQLNVESSDKNSMNCILYIVSNEDIINFDRREFDYDRIDVTDKIEEYNITGGKVFMYQQKPDYYSKSVINKSKFIVVKEFMESITTACDGIGKNFRLEYDKSTLPPIFQIVPSQRIAWKAGK